ncbi:MAG: DMT family transporter [Proteobacteria bacterium]|nr:DMT family transporter [Pseudomonadota bacterium]
MTTQIPTQPKDIVREDWVLLVVLSILWGGSFIFIGVAVKELPALLIVLARVVLAAAILLPLHFWLQGPLPRDRRSWTSFFVMSLTNNVIPFTAIVYGQHFITAGLASVINATTPLFAAVVMATAGVEGLTRRKSVGLFLGIAGVVVLRGVGFADLGQETIGILSCLLASASYGFGALWAKKRLTGIPAVTSATGQLLCSSLTVAILALLFAEPSQFLAVSSHAWLAILGLAILSTAVAYLLFFKIITRSGPMAANLVTMLIPVSAIAMGAAYLGERITANEVLGAVLIGFALLIIDGQLLRKFGLIR